MVFRATVAAADFLERLSVRLRAPYDERLHPKLIVYQYERSSTPQYPLGIVLSHHCSPEPKICLAPSIVLDR
jgi:hypothetical protein